jgi:hypothetical protein
VVELLIITVKLSFWYVLPQNRSTTGDTDFAYIPCMFSSYKYVTYLFIMQMINLFPTSTYSKSTTVDRSTLWEAWVHETSIIPPLLKCIEMSVPSRKVNGHVNVFGI